MTTKRRLLALWSPRIAGMAALVVAGFATLAAAAPTGAGTEEQRSSGWVAAWQGSPVPGGTIPAPIFNCPADKGLTDQTVRNVVFLTAGGDRVRARLTNAFGSQPLQVGSASVAIAGDGAATLPGTSRPLRFGGRSSILIAAGSEALSDPVSLKVNALQTLAISVYLPKATGPATQHFFAQQDNYVAAGDHTLSAPADAFTGKITCWMFADGVDVQAPPRVEGTVVTLGDSITDGFASTTNANRRYPDDLARRLNARRGSTLSVSNAGIGGNELLTFRTDPAFGPIFGPPAPARLDRDVLTQFGVRDVILLEGINDIGHDNGKAADLIQVDQQIITQVHAHGLKIYGATLVPFGGSNAGYGGNYGTAAGEKERQALNQWIRTSGSFDGVFDFDKATRDPQDPTRMLPAYDSGDHLHPSDAGYQSMANAVNVDALLG
ncbi:MAG: SGNH/GDSL hydrolase family protein [Actinomycetota bacterium]|jgi:lysophospholipase L1-like esterase|nr:SGNH/GDSL hydrolase family protein [Actinomycetota bacterium]